MTRPHINPFLAKALLALLALAAAAVLFLFDPANTHFYPICLFYAATGLQCPGCGSLRALHALLHGQIGRALELNPLVFTAPVFALAAFAHNKMHTGKPRLLQRPLVIWALLILLLIYWIGRNLLPFSLARE